MPLVYYYSSAITSHVVTPPKKSEITFPDLKNKSLEQDLMILGKYFTKVAANYSNSLLSDMKYKQLQIKNQKQHHMNQAKYIATVLQRLPFLYCSSKEVEEYHWRKLAYDLYKDFSLIPDVVRYQLGPNYYISYGTIVNQLKKEFFVLFNKNIKSPNCQVYSCRSHQCSLDFLGNNGLEFRPKSLNDEFEYFTPEEIRQLIIGGDRNTQDFNSNWVDKKAKCQTEWFHRWGAVYETNKDAILALNLEIWNYEQELQFLDMLLELKLQYAEVKACGLNVSQMILKKKDIIRNDYLPSLYILKAEKLEALSKTIPKSSEYYHLISY